MYRYEIAELTTQISEAEQRLNEIMREIMREFAERMAQKGKRGWIALDSDGSVFLFDLQPVASMDNLRWDMSSKIGEMTHVSDAVSIDLANRTWLDSVTEVRGL